MIGNEEHLGYCEKMSDVSSRNILENTFEKVLDLPLQASQWLLDLWDVIQVFDDFADEEKVSRESLDKAIWAALVGMPSNPFYVANSYYLLPLIGNSILKWKASDKVERDGEANVTSFVWRASYYDVVLMVVQLVHGPDVALEHSDLVLKLYGEDFNEYLKEMCDA